MHLGLSRQEQNLFAPLVFLQAEKVLVPGCWRNLLVCQTCAGVLRNRYQFWKWGFDFANKIFGMVPLIARIPLTMTKTKTSQESTSGASIRTNFGLVSIYKGKMTSSDTITSITASCWLCTTKYQPLVPYTDPVHSFITLYGTVEPTGYSCTCYFVPVDTKVHAGGENVFRALIAKLPLTDMLQMYHATHVR